MHGRHTWRSSLPTGAAVVTWFLVFLDEPLGSLKRMVTEKFSSGTWSVLTFFAVGVLFLLGARGPPALFFCGLGEDAGCQPSSSVVWALVFRGLEDDAAFGFFVFFEQLGCQPSSSMGWGNTPPLCQGHHSPPVSYQTWLPGLTVVFPNPSSTEHHPNPAMEGTLGGPHYPPVQLAVLMPTTSP
jgi:hypothetical protein